MLKHNVLVVEDAMDIANLVKLNLQDIGCQVKVAHDGNAGLREAEAKTYDLIVLDLMLPGIDGLEICRRLRARSNYTPIMMLTARATEVDRVVGLEMGADDYLVKPFSVIELTARVKAIFRRVSAISGNEVKSMQKLSAGDLSIDAERRAVRLAGNEIDLTSKEFDLLFHLMQNPGRVYSREQLLDFVWGYSYSGYEHTVNSHINRLRSKLEPDPAKPTYVLTVWGVGYKFNDMLERAA